MPAIPASAPSAPSDLAWRVVELLNLYRLLVPVVLVSTQLLGRFEWALSPTDTSLFL